MDFAKQIKRCSQETLASVERIRKAVCLELARLVIQDTPVKTGRARANWQAGLNQAPSGMLDEIDPSGEAALQRVEKVLAGLKPGDSFVLANNLDYARELEDGSSRQAPNGMLKRNAARWPELIKDAAKEGKS
jgi:hypothetical protein